MEPHDPLLETKQLAFYDSGFPTEARVIIAAKLKLLCNIKDLLIRKEKAELVCCKLIAKARAIGDM